LGQLDGKERYEKTRMIFMKSLPTDVGVYNEYHAVIVEHCKRFCRKKPVCIDCPLKRVCAFVGS
jgi:endonuclease-3 related protein